MRRFTCLIVLATAFFAAACSGDRPSPNSPAASIPGSPTGNAPAVATGGPTPSADLGDPVATRETTYDRAKVKLTVYPVRSGQLSNLTLGLTLVEPRSGEKSWVPLNVLNDRPFEPYRVNGVKLVDGTNKKIYLVATDSKQKCICSGPLVQEMEPGDTILLAATYAALPADVATVDVATTSFGTIPGVPVR